MKQQTSAAPETQLKGRTIVDFSGKILYVGIDVHKKDYQVAVVHGDVCLGNHRMAADSRKVIEHLSRRYPGAIIKCVYESCGWGFTLQRQLQAAGMDCIVVHAADVSTSDKERKRKTDPVDALKLARTLAAGHLKGIHIPDEEGQRERNLIRYRKRLVGDLNRSKNRLKSLLKFQGIVIPEQFEKNTKWSKNFLIWIEQEATKDPWLCDVVMIMLEQIKFLRILKLKVEKQLREMMATKKYSEPSRLVMSIPGIGRITAMLFLLEMGDIKRFKGFDALNDFVGFCPDCDSSGEKQRTVGLSKRKHNALRSALVEAAWVAIKRDPALLACYEQLTKRMSGKRAIIRIARKLLRRMRAVLISGIPYQPGVVS